MLCMAVMMQGLRPSPRVERLDMQELFESCWQTSSSSRPAFVCCFNFVRHALTFFFYYFWQANIKEALQSLLPESAGPFTPSLARDSNAKRTLLKTKSSSNDRTVSSPLMARSSSGIIGSPMLERKVASVVESESSLSSLIQFNTMTDLRADNPLSPPRAAPKTCLEARKQLMNTPNDAVATFQYAKLLAHDGFVVSVFETGLLCCAHLHKVRACIWATRACELTSGYEEAEQFVQKLRSQLGEKNEAESVQLKTKIKAALAAPDYQAAIKLLERLEVVELVLNASAIRNRAVCWQRLNRHDLAIEFYEEYIILRPNASDVKAALDSVKKSARKGGSVRSTQPRGK